MGSRKHVPFGVKIETFWNTWPPDPQNRQNLPNFGRDLEENFYMTDDDTWPRKVKVVTQLSLGPNISKKAGDRGLVTMGD